jgi:galactokinase
MIDILKLVSMFQELYGARPRLFRAPGRVNLIGEHTDYNDGFVLPMAINLGTIVAIAARRDRIVRIRSLNLNESIELDLEKLSSGHQGAWRDYVEGIASALMESGVVLRGADIAIQSDVPIGSGLSSSAALEIALAKALLSISNGSIDNLSLALAGQRAEHKHVGIHCGIMDQFTAVHALKEHAILLDCRSLDANLIPLNLQDCKIVICDTRVRHQLAYSEYNQRRQDCEKGVRLLRTALPEIRALRDVSLSELEANRSFLPESILRRCTHVIGENSRTLKAAECLAHGDLAGMGELMCESHRSLRNNYEVSCPELDRLVESAENQPGVLGARMTGGGFGGCTVNLVEDSRISSFRECTIREYHAVFNLVPNVSVVEAASGAEEIASWE